ncbi:MBOAT family protein [Candidatus Poribacteria bacterium]|nr:MBOAT family protein [Candidatus Poribacteria bacterium]
MLFNTLEYGVFLVVVVALYYALSPRARTYLLFAASIFFYMSWKAEYILLLLGTVTLYYVFLRQMSKRETGRKFWLILCLIVALSPLAYFKYSSFLYSNAVSVFNVLFGFDLVSRKFNLILPLGISFYTFQLLSYAMDIYRGKASLERYWVFLLYILFFPHLIAGPIVRAHILMPQIASRSCAADSKQFDDGITLILFGLFKKVVIADYLASLVDPRFVGKASIPSSGLDCLLLLYAFSFQIYFDFAGYSDIARGSAKLLGFELPVNFNFPYVARNVREFWRRWHITLSTWLRDYLYIPLGGSRKGELRLYFSLFMTMVIGGLWHGAAWTFVYWGALHGIALMITRFFQEKRRASEKEPAEDRGGPMRNFFSVLLTYNLVCLGWLFFRAPGLDFVKAFLSQLLHFAPGYLESNLPPTLGPLLLCLFVGQWLIHSVRDRIHLPAPRLARAFVFAILIIVITIFSQRGTSFLYFQF